MTDLIERTAYEPHVTPRASTPIRRNRQSSHRFEAVSSVRAEDVQISMAKEMKGLLVGPMAMPDFLHNFVPQCTDPLPTVQSGLFLPLLEAKREDDMYAPFIQALMGSHLIPGFKVVNTSNHPDVQSKVGRKIRPDSSMYQADLSLEDGVMCFSELELSFELKLDAKEDPFCNHSDKKDPETCRFSPPTAAKGKMKNFGQLIGYATEWCSLQHRTFAFTVGIFGSYARFIRWDRSGAVVSERFDYQKNPHYLATFLWRFVHLTPEDRGRDVTVRNASPQEAKIASQKLSKWSHNNKRSPVVFTIKDNSVDREFIGLGSMADAESLTGRATRAYPVWDIKREKLCFLKDSWRAVALEGEADIIRELNREGVRYVPIIVCGGDMPVEHKTKTHLYSGSTQGLPTWSCRVVERIHHRFVVDFIGQPLTHFPSTHRFIRTILHACTAHQEACEKCKILHRDIGVGNIMQDEEGNGVLIDWDLSKRITSSNTVEKHRNHERTGTWQFISCLMLNNPTKEHVLQDDLESFVWVIVYTALCYTKHNLCYERVQTILKKVFDPHSEIAGKVEGGEQKDQFARFPRLHTQEEWTVDGNQVLTTLIHDLLKAVTQWHQYAGPKLSIQERIIEAPWLRDHTWLNSRLSRALENPGWPEGDRSVPMAKAKLNPKEQRTKVPNMGPKTTRTRTKRRNDSNAESEIKRTKLLHKSLGAGS